MPATLTLQNTMDWAQPFCMYKPLDVAFVNEPVLTNANTVLQTILGPPFTWRWNRRSIVNQGPTVAGTQDYTAFLSDFGTLESAALVQSGDVTQLQIKSQLAHGSQRDKPTDLSVLLEDTSVGANPNLTFRFLPVPDAVYTFDLVYQKKAVALTGFTSTWAPIPDEFSYIYNRGFLALSLLFAEDPRWEAASQQFMSCLLAASEGLTEGDRDIFMSNWVMKTQTLQAALGKTQQGVQARAV